MNSRLAAASAFADEKAKTKKWTFEDAKVGSVPKGWIAGVTGSKKGKAPQWEVIQVNRMGEPCYATPALVDGKIYLRTESALYCFDQG